MKCYNHEQNDAVGVCKDCQKGICKECSTLVNGSISCIGACEENVATLNKILEQSNKVYKNLSSQWSPSIFINGIAGSLFLGFGIYQYNRNSSWLFIGLGLVMIIGGIMSYLQSKKIRRENEI